MHNDGTGNVDYATTINRRGEEASTTAFERGGGGQVFADFKQSFDRTNSYSQAATPSSYTVRSGDTLGGIASAIWGDASLWYKIAGANGLTGSSALAAGSQLRIPQNVTRSSNNASTFKVYNPAEAIGDTAPTTPEPPKAGGKCGIFGQIIATVVAVAASYLVGPIIGNVVSQGFNNLIGIQKGFSFKSLAISALSTAVTLGVGGIGGPVGNFLNGGSILGDVARASLSSGITQGLSVATGLQDKFDFAGVAAAGIGAGLGNIAGAAAAKAGGSVIAQDAAFTTASAIANAATRSAIEGSSFGDNLQRAIPDVVGQLFGRVLGRGIGTAFDGVSSKVTDDPATQSRTKTGQVAEELVTGGGGPIVTYGATQRVERFNPFTPVNFDQDILSNLSPEALLFNAQSAGLVRSEDASNLLAEISSTKQALFANDSGRSQLVARFASDKAKAGALPPSERVKYDIKGTEHIEGGGQPTGYDFTGFLIDQLSRGADAREVASFFFEENADVYGQQSGEFYGQGLIASGNIFQIETQVIPVLQANAAGDINPEFWKRALEEVNGYIDPINSQVTEQLVDDGIFLLKSYAAVGLGLAAAPAGAAVVSGAGATGGTALALGLTTEATFGAGSLSLLRNAQGQEVTAQTVGQDALIAGGFGLAARGGGYLVNRFTPSGILNEAAATKQLLGTTTTPNGRQINFHAAFRMAEPPRGRLAMTPTQVDQVLDGATHIMKRTFHPLGDTITVRNVNMVGSPRVAVDAETGNRIITVINPKGK